MVLTPAIVTLRGIRPPWSSELEGCDPASLSFLQIDHFQARARIIQIDYRPACPNLADTRLFSCLLQAVNVAV